MINTNISGETMIFKNDKGIYSTTLSNKQQDGTYQNAYIGVQFKKGVDIPNKTIVNIKNAFLSFNKVEGTDGKERTFFKIVVLDYELGNGTATQKAPATKSKKVPADDIIGADSEDDLPF